MPSLSTWRSFRSETSSTIEFRKRTSSGHRSCRCHDFTVRSWCRSSQTGLEPRNSNPTHDSFSWHRCPYPLEPEWHGSGRPSAIRALAGSAHGCSTYRSSFGRQERIPERLLHSLDLLLKPLQFKHRAVHVLRLHVAVRQTVQQGHELGQVRDTGRHDGSLPLLHSWLSSDVAWRAS